MVEYVYLVFTKRRTGRQLKYIGFVLQNESSGDRQKAAEILENFTAKNIVHQAFSEWDDDRRVSHPLAVTGPLFDSKNLNFMSAQGRGDVIDTAESTKDLIPGFYVLKARIWSVGAPDRHGSYAGIQTDLDRGFEARTVRGVRHKVVVKLDLLTLSSQDMARAGLWLLKTFGNVF
jgi:hypothetical protein